MEYASIKLLAFGYQDVDRKNSLKITLLHLSLVLSVSFEQYGIQKTLLVCANVIRSTFYLFYDIGSCTDSYPSQVSLQGGELYSDSHSCVSWFTIDNVNHLVKLDNARYIQVLSLNELQKRDKH